MESMSRELGIRVEEDLSDQSGRNVSAQDLEQSMWAVFIASPQESFTLKARLQVLDETVIDIVRSYFLQRGYSEVEPAVRSPLGSLTLAVVKESSLLYAVTFTNSSPGDIRISVQSLSDESQGGIN